MSKYIWSWYDGDGNYCNKAESLEEIIETVLTYYFDPDDDESECKVQVMRNGDTFNVSMEHQTRSERYEIRADEEAALNFLQDIAQKEDRPDVFAIYFL